MTTGLFSTSAIAGFVTTVIIGLLTVYIVMRWWYINLSGKEACVTSFHVYAVFIAVAIMLILDGVAAFAWSDEDHIDTRKNLLYAPVALTLGMWLYITYWFSKDAGTCYKAVGEWLRSFLSMAFMASLIFHVQCLAVQKS
jgi:hypothetical protein